VNVSQLKLRSEKFEIRMMMMMMMMMMMIIIIIIISHTRKTFSRFTVKDSCTWNSTHSTERTAV
jgi:hypothetical protein